MTLTDAAGNTGTAVTATARLDQAVPYGYLVTADAIYVTSANASSTGFTFSGATVGDTYNYSASSDGGGTAVTGSGTVTSATQDVTGINVSEHADRRHAHLQRGDAERCRYGNTGVTAVAAAVLDRVAPSGYTVVPSAAYGPNSTAASFTIQGAEVNATYSYSISDDGVGRTAPITGSGTVTSATQTVSGINLSALPEGTLTFSVILTDPAGNVGTTATATATMDRTAPSGYSIALIDNGVFGSTTDTSAGFTFTDAVATAGTIYTCTVTDSTGATVTNTGSVTSATQTVTGIDISSLADGVAHFQRDANRRGGQHRPGRRMHPGHGPAGHRGPQPLSGHARPAGRDDATTETAAGFTFINAELNTTYHYTVTDINGKQIAAAAR